MFEFTDTALNKLIIHGIGNKSENEGVNKSSNTAVLDEETKDLLMTYFLNPFKSEEFYGFFHEEDLNKNTLFPIVSDIFENPDILAEKSGDIAWHLYNVSSHPKINSGEMYVVYFKDVTVDDEVTDAIGIFKSETKETFLKVYEKNQNYEVGYDTGINIRKLEKGCLIFDTEDDNGYKISIVDKLNTGAEAQYWKDDFLKVKPRNDSYNTTNNFLEIIKGFSEHVLNEENNVETKEKIAFLQKTQNFLKENEKFSENRFNEEVISQPEVINAFNEYKNEYIDRQELSEIDDGFDISQSAFKANSKYFRSVIKLDKNFHIYVHSKPEYIKKGYDEDKKMSFYQLFFNNEE
jgi:hypothetical protein